MQAEEISVEKQVGVESSGGLDELFLNHFGRLHELDFVFVLEKCRNVFLSANHDFICVDVCMDSIEILRLDVFDLDDGNILEENFTGLLVKETMGEHSPEVLAPSLQDHLVCFEVMVLHLDDHIETYLTERSILACFQLFNVEFLSVILL